MCCSLNVLLFLGVALKDTCWHLSSWALSRDVIGEEEALRRVPAAEAGSEAVPVVMVNKCGQVAWIKDGWWRSVAIPGIGVGANTLFMSEGLWERTTCGMGSWLTKMTMRIRAVVNQEGVGSLVCFLLFGRLVKKEVLFEMNWWRFY